jgi:hypothetical protein
VMCLQCAVRCKQRNTKIFEHSSILTTCVGKSVKDIGHQVIVKKRSVILCKIRVMVECCKVASAKEMLAYHGSEILEC